MMYDCENFVCTYLGVEYIIYTASSTERIIYLPIQHPLGSTPVLAD